MIHFKNRSEGFTFIEIIVSLFIIGLLMGALMQLSHQTLVYVSQYSGRLQRLYLLKNSLFDVTFALLKEEKPATRENPVQTYPTKISYREQKIAEGSSLKEFKDTISMYHIKGEWNSVSQTLQENIIVYMITEKKDKKTP